MYTIQSRRSPKRAARRETNRKIGKKNTMKIEQLVMPDAVIIRDDRKDDMR